MVKLRLIVILIFAVVCISPDYVPDLPKLVGRSLMERYIWQLASYNKRNTDATKKIYSDAILTYADKYRVPAAYIARQIFKESLYDNTCVGADGERGCSQIKTVHHGWIFKTLSSYSRLHSVEEQAHWVNNSVEVQCWLMSNYYYRYKDYKVAVVCYWRGEYSWELKDYFRGKWIFENTEYYKQVMLPDYILQKYFAVSNMAEWAYTVAVNVNR